MAQPEHWRVMADLALLSLFAGMYSVPMYALIQLRSQPTHRARIIAANNILNALFMIASSVIAGALLKSGFTIPQIFLLTGHCQRGSGVLYLPVGARVLAALRGHGLRPRLQEKPEMFQASPGSPASRGSAIRS
jgi:hypothetical protein